MLVKKREVFLLNVGWGLRMLTSQESFRMLNTTTLHGRNFEDSVERPPST